MRSFIFILIVLLLLSVAANVFLVFSLQNSSGSTLSSLRQKYPLLSGRAINPRNSTELVVNFLPLRNHVHKMVDHYKDTFALYFEYLPTGTSIGINEDKEFTAESLLKVPVVMAYFYKKEQLHQTTDDTVAIQKNELNSQFGDLYKKGVGYQINLADVVKLALQKSDNTASLVLADQISADDFNNVYEGLDIPETTNKNSPIITTHEYSSILKALYFGSVLNNDDSEFILHLLTQTDFTSMLPSGVPKGIPVAHKIGLVNKEIYSDCGIVYVPSKPYIMCMVSKSDNKTAKQRMHDLSKIVYEYVNQL